MRMQKGWKEMYELFVQDEMHKQWFFDGGATSEKGETSTVGVGFSCPRGETSLLTNRRISWQRWRHNKRSWGDSH